MREKECVRPPIAEPVRGADLVVQPRQRGGRRHPAHTGANHNDIKVAIWKGNHYLRIRLRLMSDVELRQTQERLLLADHIYLNTPVTGLKSDGGESLRVQSAGREWVEVHLGHVAVQIRLKHREARQKETQCAAQSLETEEPYAIENG